MGRTVAVIAPMVDVTQYHLDLALRLKGSNRELTLATLHELAQNGFRSDLLPAVPSKRDMLPAAGYYLTGLLREKGYHTVTTHHLTPESLQMIAAASPFAVCLSTTMILGTGSLKQIITEIRRHLPDVPVIVGGVFVWKSYQFYAFYQQEIPVDNTNPLLFSTPSREIPADVYVVASHGRDPLLSVLLELERGSKSDFTHIPNLALPQPDGTYFFTSRQTEEINYDQDFTRWDLLDELPEQIPVRTSIGCPFRCRYCDFYQLYPQIFIRSKESLIAELGMIRQRLGEKQAIIHATDDNVFIHHRHVKEVTAAFTEAGIRQWIGFMRASAINEANIQDIQRSGLLMSLIGMESGDKGQLKRMNKALNLEAAKHGIELLDQHGITVLMTFIVGFPGETHETIAETGRFLNGLDIGLASSSYLLFPLIISPFSDLARPEFREKWEIKGYIDHWSHYTMHSQETVHYGYELFKQVTHLPYHYTEERTFQNRVLFNDSQRGRLFHLRQQLTLAFLEQEHWDTVRRILREVARVIGFDPIDIPEQFRNDVWFDRKLVQKT